MEFLEIAHAIPGRVRFQCKYANKSNEGSFPNLDNFLKIPGVEEVVFNKITKTILVMYDQNKLNLSNLITEIQKKIPHIKISPIDPSKNRTSFDDDTSIESLFSNIIYKLGADLNKSVYSKTGGRTDLVSTTAVGLALVGLIEMIRRPVAPRWYDFMWYAYNILQTNPNRPSRCYHEKIVNIPKSKKKNE